MGKLSGFLFGSLPSLLPASFLPPPPPPPHPFLVKLTGFPGHDLPAGTPLSPLPSSLSECSAPNPHHNRDKNQGHVSDKGRPPGFVLFLPVDFFFL